MERTIALWICGLLASVLMGTAAGAEIDITDFDYAPRLWGAAVGILAFGTANLLLAVSVNPTK